MPLFSYACAACGAKSEILVRGNEEPACPQCGSRRMEKQASHFAALSSAASAPACASGACAAASSCPMGGCCME
ncbi:MAG: zinc ribbon domain-containing protein [Candidatus Hydrogenedentes bacterium]|nr:zinc ribbon domain-containing protein [Candidatus Hydrogenedentota bacterium]